jgi:hypothetical protein
VKQFSAVEVCVFEGTGQFGGRYDDVQSWERHEQDMDRAEIAREKRRGFIHPRSVVAKKDAQPVIAKKEERKDERKA